MQNIIPKLCYTDVVHKPIYASGFLYHLATQQILLQQHVTGDSTPPWTLFSGQNHEGEDATATFQRIIQNKLGLDLSATNIFPVYDYVRDIHNTIHYIFYAEVPTLYTFPFIKDSVLAWFTYKLTTKLQFDDQTKQDVIVSERVIRAQAKSNEPAIALTHQRS